MKYSAIISSIIYFPSLFSHSLASGIKIKAMKLFYFPDTLEGKKFLENGYIDRQYLIAWINIQVSSHCK